MCRSNATVLRILPCLSVTYSSSLPLWLDGTWHCLSIVVDVTLQYVALVMFVVLWSQAQAKLASVLLAQDSHGAGACGGAQDCCQHWKTPLWAICFKSTRSSSEFSSPSYGSTRRQSFPEIQICLHELGSLGDFAATVFSRYSAFSSCLLPFHISNVD